MKSNTIVPAVPSPTDVVPAPCSTTNAMSASIYSGPQITSFFVSTESKLLQVCKYDVYADKAHVLYEGTLQVDQE